MRGIWNWAIRRRLTVAFAGVLIPYLALASVGTVGLWAIWRSVEEVYHEATVEQRVLWEAESAIDQVNNSAREYLTAGGPAAQAHLERRIRQLHEVLARLQPTLFHEAEEQQLVMTLRSRGARIERLGQEILAASDGPADASALAKLKALHQQIGETSPIVNQVQAITLREMGEEVENVLRAIRRLIVTSLAALVVSVAGGVALAFIVSAWLTRPILAIAKVSRGMAEGDLSQRVKTHASGELGEAAQAFNEMAERLEASVAALAAREADLINRNREMSALVRALEALYHHENLEELLPALVEQARILSGARYAALVLLGPAGQIARFHTAGLSPEDVARIGEPPKGRGVLGLVLRSAGPVRVDDLTAHPEAAGFPPGHPPMRTFLGVPIVVEGKTVGSVYLTEKEGGRRFGPEDERVLVAFSEIAALAIRRTRLLNDVERHVGQMSALFETGKAILATRGVEPTIAIILEKARELTGAGTAGLFQLDAKTSRLRFSHSVGLDALALRDHVLRPGEGVAGRAVAEGVPVWTTDVLNDPQITLEGENRERLRRLGLRAVLAAPLKLQALTIGALVAHSREPNRFRGDQVEAFTALASLAAIALEHSRLFQAEQERRRQVEAVQAISQEMTRELDLPTLLGLIIRRAVNLVGVASGEVYLWDEASQVLVPAAWHGVGDWMREVRLRLGEGVSGTVAQRRQQMIVNDCRAWPYAHPAFLERTAATAILAEPLLYQDRLLGVIALNDEGTGRPFTEQESETLALFAAHAAIAVENARLYGAALEKTERLEGLTRTIAKIVGTLRVEEVLDAIAEEAAKLLRVEGAGFRLIEGDQLVVGGKYGLAHHVMLRPSISVGESHLPGLVAQHARPVSVPDLREDQSYLAEHKAAVLTHGVVAYLGVPLRYQDKVIGVLNVYGKERRTFHEGEVSLLSSFADQAAIAIANARLHEAIRHHAEELDARVRERTAELEEALRVKAQFLANMSHELRTPLNAVLGFSEVLLGRGPGDLTPKQERYLQQVHQGGKRLLELVSNILEMTGTPIGPAAFHLDRVPVDEFVREVLRPLHLAAGAKSVVLETALDPGLPHIVADRQKLTQILHHLVTNAIRLTPTGGRVAVGAQRIGTPAGEEAEITVTDTGIGVRSEDLERIFKGFEQANTTHTAPYGGAGLGLALVRHLVELHGGRVWAESEGEGHGARFVVRLPLLAAPETPRVLVVEDEKPVLEAICTTLATAGYGVDRACTGTEALVSLAASPPSLLVLDIRLPDMDGWEVLKQVRSAEETRDLPVLVLTGLDYVHADQALALGADEFLAKPVSARVLADTVARLLARPARETAG